MEFFYIYEKKSSNLNFSTCLKKIVKIDVFESWFDLFFTFHYNLFRSISDVLDTPLIRWKVNQDLCCMWLAVVTGMHTEARAIITQVKVWKTEVREYRVQDKQGGEKNHICSPQKSNTGGLLLFFHVPKFELVSMPAHFKNFWSHIKGLLWVGEHDCYFFGDAKITVAGSWLVRCSSFPYTPF